MSDPFLDIRKYSLTTWLAMQSYMTYCFSPFSLHLRFQYLESCSDSLSFFFEHDSCFPFNRAWVLINMLLAGSVPEAPSYRAHFQNQPPCSPHPPLSVREPPLSTSYRPAQCHTHCVLTPRCTVTPTARAPPLTCVSETVPPRHKTSRIAGTGHAFG